MTTVIATARDDLKKVCSMVPDRLPRYALTGDHYEIACQDRRPDHRFWAVIGPRNEHEDAYCSLDAEE